MATAPPRSRAAVVLYGPAGTVLYINDCQVAKEFLREFAASLGTSSATDGDIDSRSRALHAATDTHDALNTLNGYPSHALGCAAARAATQLTKGERSAVAGIRKTANAARHSWPPRVPDTAAETDTTLLSESTYIPASAVVDPTSATDFHCLNGCGPLAKGVRSDGEASESEGTCDACRRDVTKGQVVACKVCDFWCCRRCQVRLRSLTEADQDEDGHDTGSSATSGPGSGGETSDTACAGVGPSSVLSPGKRQHRRRRRR